MSFRYDKQTEKWIADNVTDLDTIAVNNFLQYGQPYHPYEPNFNHEHANEHYSINPTVVVSQNSVMFDGYGQSVSALDFPVIQRLLGSEIFSNESILKDGLYSFQDLINLGLVKENERSFGRRLYFGSDSGDIDPWDSLYVHGSVGFALKSGSEFLVRRGRVVEVDAEIGALDDNFDFQSDFISSRLNNIVQLLFGPDPDYVPQGSRLDIEYRGAGKRSSVTLTGAPQLGAPITMPSGSPGYPPSSAQRRQSAH